MRGLNWKTARRLRKGSRTFGIDRAQTLPRALVKYVPSLRRLTWLIGFLLELNNNWIMEYWEARQQRNSRTPLSNVESLKPRVYVHRHNAWGETFGDRKGFVSCFYLLIRHPLQAARNNWISRKEQLSSVTCANHMPLFRGRLVCY